MVDPLPFSRASRSDHPNVFDFLNDITRDKKFILNEDNVHKYSKYLITRFLSTRTEYHMVVDILNKFQGTLDEFEFHRLAMCLINTRKAFTMNKGAQITYTTDINQVKEQVETIGEYFMISPREAHEYYKIGGEDLVRDIRILNGIN